MMSKLNIDIDCLYVNGDSWAYGSELRNPDRLDVTDDYDPVHATYRERVGWPGLLGKQLNVPVLNGGQAGGSNQRIMRTALGEVGNLKRNGRKPLVIIAWTQMQRFELYDGKAHHWLDFVNPAAENNRKIGLEIWERYSSDRSDVQTYLQQLIYMDAFLKMNNVPYLGTNIFRHNWNIVEDFAKDPEFFPHLHQLSNNVNIAKHLYNVSITQILAPHVDVEYGPGGHPLERGQEIIAEHFYNKLTQHYQFKNTQA